MEHHSNLVPWQLLAQEKDADLEFVPFDEDGLLRHDSFEVLLRTKPKLVAFTHVSNGSARSTRSRRWSPRPTRPARWCSSTAPRPCPHEPVDVQALGVDFYVFSGHKTLGPQGSGALWARRELLEEMPPFMGGGEMIREVHLRHTTYNEVPYKFEAGTPDVGAAIGLGRRGRLPDGPRHGPRPRTRARPHRPTPSRRCRARCRASASTARWLPATAPASSRSTCRASTRTTWPRCSTARRSRSAPATTARCRSTSGSVRRPGPRQLLRLHRPRGHRRPGGRPQGSPARLQRLTPPTVR